MIHSQIALDYDTLIADTKLICGKGVGYRKHIKKSPTLAVFVLMVNKSATRQHSANLLGVSTAV